MKTRAELVKDGVRNENVFHDPFVCVDSVHQDVFGHLQAHENRFTDVAVHIQVLKRILGDGARHACLAEFHHGVNACALDLGGFTVSIVFGDFHDRMMLVRIKVDGDHPEIKVQVTQNLGQAARWIHGELNAGKGSHGKTLFI